MNPENVLVWENERGFLSCKLIDFGEVIPKKKDNFTPLFWDFSRLLGEMILNFVEETMDSVGDGRDRPLQVDSILSEFWTVIQAFFQNDPSKLEKANPQIGFISWIYLSTLFDFINEAKSGMRDLRRTEVLQDYFYCQALFFFFFAKFGRENPYKRLFGVKLGLKLYEYAKSEENKISPLITSLEKFYFDFAVSISKNKKKQVGPAVGAHSPFKGLSYFEEKDKDVFFGREKFTKELLQAIEEKPIVALAGASGSGKSSVVHAGVIPALRGKKYLIYKFRPGSSPIAAAIKALNRRDPLDSARGTDSPIPSEKERSSSKKSRSSSEVEMSAKERRSGVSDLRELIVSIIKDNPKKKIFLLGDQFEELFTLTTDDLERRELGEAILDIAREFKDQFRFFITIRADFLTKLLEDPSFASVIGDSGDNKDLGERLLLSPMNTDELRSAIEKPLKVAKLGIQEGLTDLILTSVANQPGSLPLLQFCLEELWKRQIDYTLQYNAYKEIGEVKGALATYADQEYAKLNPIEQESLKKIMLQLIQPGQGTEDTRRIAIVEDVAPLDSARGANSLAEGRSPSGVEGNFIQHLADLRLITTGTNEEGKQTLEVVHEALIREWKLLREWINADREFRVWQEKIRYAMKEWESGEKREDLLLRGSNLITALDWYETRKNDLSQREVDYIEKSRKRDRRNKILLWTAGTIVASLILGFGVFGTVMYFRAKAANDEAKIANAEAMKNKQEAEKAQAIAEKERKDADKAKAEAKISEDKAIGEAKKAEEEKKKASELKSENEKKEIALKKQKAEVEDITAKLAKGFRMDKQELLGAADLKRWSKYQGEMNWEDAKKQCASLGKGWRLPKRGEWQVNYGANPKVKKEWA